MKNKGMGWVLLLGVCFLITSCVDSGTTFGIPGEVNFFITIEREQQMSPNSTLSIFVKEYERKKTDEGDILVFQCPCFLGGEPGLGFFSPDMRHVASAQIDLLTKLEMRLLPGAKYNIDVVAISE